MSKITLRLLLLLLALVIATPIALVIALNSRTGRELAVTQINKFAGPGIAITGLGGHFPADLKIAAATMSDPHGVYLTAQHLELRWQPQKLLSRTLQITALTADSIAISRQPVPAAPSGKSSPSLPNLHLILGHLGIEHLALGAALTGQPARLAVTGSADVPNLTQGSATIVATADDGGTYRLTAALDHQAVAASLHIAEPPGGLIGHYAAPHLTGPLALDLILAGPCDNADLNLNAALDAARLTADGTIALDPDAPRADLVLTIPALAPFAAIANQTIAGATTLHLLASRHATTTEVALDGGFTLTAAPDNFGKLLGTAHLALAVSLSGGNIAVQNFALDGTGLTATAHGAINGQHIALTTHLVLRDVHDLTPALTGGIATDATISGTTHDFATHAVITGSIADPAIPSGPFTVTLDAAHLPRAPTGILHGSGQLEAATLALDAGFTRDAAKTTVHINQASWKSLTLQANLLLDTGDTLPTGTATFAVTRLADFARFVPKSIPLGGRLRGAFAHQTQQDFTLELTAGNLMVDKQLGAINANLQAKGPLAAIAVQLNATLAKLLGAAARLAASGTVDLNARSATLTSLSASWKTLNATLQGPAVVLTRPDLTIQHLHLALNGASIALNGIVSPRLAATIAIHDLPVSLARIAAPSLAATGTFDAAATLTGTLQAPRGTATLTANAIHLATGSAAALPPADLTAATTIGPRTASLAAALALGPNATLAAHGSVPLTATGPLDLALIGRTDLRLLDPILAVHGTVLRGLITPDLVITGTPRAPLANGTVTLAGGSVQNIGSGLNLTQIAGRLTAAGRQLTLEALQATAGKGSISGHGTVDLGHPSLPIALTLDAKNATPIASDLITEALDAAFTLNGALRGHMALGGTVTIDNANINIPKSLPPAVAVLPIINRGAPPLPAPPPPPDIGLALLIHARNQIFIRGDGLFVELGGHVNISGTAAQPIPEGGFTLIRGSLSLGGKNLQFTKGIVSFNGAGFTPTLDLEASTTTGTTTATLIIGGTAALPTITLTSSPPLPSDEVLAHLLFGQGTQNLSPFQAASLAAALASLSGVGGGAVSDPLGGVRNALGLDELSLGGGQNGGAPSLQAGRYVAPGVYVGATQSVAGGGTQATVEVNLYKGLKLQTATGTSGGGGGETSSVGLTYQFNY